MEAKKTETTIETPAGYLMLRLDSDGRYRWYDVDGTDLECGGATVRAAAEAILAAYPDDSQWSDEAAERVRVMITTDTM